MLANRIAIPKKKTKIMKRLSIPLILIVSLLVLFNQVWAQTTSTDKENLIYQLEEERLAHDVYTVLSEKWEINAFTNIQEAEQKHFDKLIALAEQQNIKIPAAVRKGKPGVYKNKDLQEAYDKMVADGQTSLEAALKVGAKIEEMDIKDLQESIAETTDKATLDVYQHLLEGSEKHLRAFNRNLEKLSIDYQPVILTQAQFDKIIGAKEGCGGKGEKANCCQKGKGQGGQKAGCCKKASD